MVRIPTPIPESVVKGVRRLFSGRVLDVLWKLFVISLLAVAVYLMALSGAFILVFFAGTILSIWLADDIRQSLSDVWNRNFWIWEPK